MDRTYLAALVFFVAYSAVVLAVRWRAGRHARPGQAPWVRFGLGWEFLRADSYTVDGQRYRRLLIWLYVGALPLLVVWLWLWGAL